MDETTMEVRNIENLCRLCLSTDEPRSSVFSERATTLSLATKIHNFLSIEILASDKLSTSICTECLTRVNKWQSYKESCLRSQEKLQRCLAERSENISHVPNIKTEPMDFDESPGSLETVPLTSDDEWETIVEESSTMEVSTRAEKPISPRESLTIKREALEDEQNQNTGIESSRGAELLLNPMAVATTKDDRVMEADSTQKLFNPKSLKNKKKKLRRGPATHYRGARKYKQRCNYCQIYLHSKQTYAKHMERFHTDTKHEKKIKISESKKYLNDNIEEIEEEMIEDVEEELINLEKDSPLTPVQQNIISQLKTFSCYSCRQSFNDRRSTLNHIRQHMPDLRPYTCIACLTEFADRSIYKLHCGASFQCAMKIALVVPENGTEKYFTCNMCLRPLSNRKELLTHLSRHSDKQYEQLIGRSFRSPPKLKPMSLIPSISKKIQHTSKNEISPIKSDLSGKNLCELCGMIYKHKQNLTKHREYCEKLLPNERICHRCIYCDTTFTSFSKFRGHIKNGHKKRNFVCSYCFKEFNESNEYIEHHRQHRFKDNRLTTKSGRVRKIKKWENFEESKDNSLKSMNRWSCAICPKSTFPTKSQLVEHRKIHQKLKIYSCSICRRMFEKVSDLESHMIEHNSYENMAANTSQPIVSKYDQNVSKNSINSDPGLNSSECHTCGKVFASYQNLRRHIRNVHEAPGRYNCFSCSKNFKTENEWHEHVEKDHRQFDDLISCSQCTKTFDTAESLIAHRREIHGIEDDDPLACYICGKIFQTITSLKIHRGHHFRVNSRLSIGNISTNEGKKNEIEDDDDPISIISTINLPTSQSSPLPVKTPRAKKSFPNSPSRQLQNILQCQVCDDRFNDVATLRKHLWDVHCARNKPEKSFNSVKLQCELCTNILPDDESLRSHMKWHESNPILGNNVATKKEPQAPVGCDICGKFYSSYNSLKTHKQRHKELHHSVETDLPKNRKGERWGGKGFKCNDCQKVFATNSTLLKHQIVCITANRNVNNDSMKKSRDNEIVDTIRPKFDFDQIVERANSFNDEDTRKPIICNLCRKILPSHDELHKHRIKIHKVTNDNIDIYGIKNDNNVSCTSCKKIFSSLTNMRQHYTKVHVNNGPNYSCSFDNCRLIFRSYVAKKNHEKTHSNIIYACPVCPKRMPTRTAINQHIEREHKNNSLASNNMKNDKIINLKKINLDNYVVKGAIGRQCPLCKITYPNNKALKVHYIKVHENFA